MSKDTEIVKRLAKETGLEIEIRKDDPDASQKYRARLDNHCDSWDDFILIDHVNSQSRLAIVDGQNRVVRLYLNGAGLAELPATLFSLVNLKLLFLWDGHFGEIPPSIVALRELQVLVVGVCQELRELPAELARLPKLLVADIFSNHLSTPPAKIAKQGIGAIRNYFQSLEQAADVDYLYEAKMVLVGRGFAGKTSLVRKLTIDGYALEDDIKSTEGIDIKIWDLEMPLDRADSFRFNIWDFGGQEKYDATHQFFITERTVYLFVTQARQESNYLDFDYWLNIVQILGDNSPVIVIQNKIDQRKRSMPSSKYRGQFPNILEFVDVSCADGYEKTISKLTGTIKQAVSKLPQVGDKLPAEWVGVREDLKALDVDYITYGEYCKICGHRGLSKERADFLSSYFHDLGVIVHYRRDPLLKKTVIVNPDWAVDGVYNVLDSPAVEEKHGRFSDRDLAKIWTDKKYKDKHPELLALMKNYQLCFELPGTGTYIAPELLAADATKYKPIKKAGRLTFIYRYQFMPAGLITRLIVKIHRLIDGEHFWRTGAVVKSHEGARAAIVEDDAARIIRIDIEGADDAKRDLLAVIRNAFADIYADFNRRIEFEEFVPCSCSQCLAHIEEDQEPHLFKWSTLCGYSTERIAMIRCETSLTEVGVGNLIGKVTDKVDTWEESGRLTASQLPTVGRDNEEHTLRAAQQAIGVTTAPTWQKLTAAAIGVALVLILLALAVFFPNPTEFQLFVFRVVLALAAGAVGALIPGFIEVRFRGWFRATGAAAFFAVVYFANPPALVVDSHAAPAEPAVIKDGSTDPK